MGGIRNVKHGYFESHHEDNDTNISPVFGKPLVSTPMESADETQLTDKFNIARQ